jgi:hypothetical protein
LPCRQQIARRPDGMQEDPATHHHEPADPDPARFFHQEEYGRSQCDEQDPSVVEEDPRKTEEEFFKRLKDRRHVAVSLIRRLGFRGCLVHDAEGP